MTLIQKLRSILTPTEQMKFAWLLLAILLMGFFEVVGIASILPFMQLLSEPDAIEKSSLLNSVYSYFQFDSHRAMLVATGFGVIALITISNLFSALTVWFQYKFSWSVAHNLETRLLRSYLRKPYSYFLNVNTSELQTYLVGEVNALTGGLLIPVLELISRSIVSMVIFGLLLWLDVKVALTMATVLGGAYLLIYFSQQHFLKRLGKLRIAKNMQRYQTLAELLTGIKTVKVSQTQDYFYNRYADASLEFCEVQPKVSILMAIPRYFLEIFAFGGILAVTLYLYTLGGNLQSALPRLSLYAVAGYRLLPALQRAFTSASRIKHYNPVLEKLQPDLAACLIHESAQKVTTAPLSFQKEFAFENLQFHYEEMPNLVINNLNLKINKGQIVAFVGSTGAGKTTLIDLMVGLLHPTGGHLKIDGKTLNLENVNTWRQQIAYVPQDIFLFDDSIARNIVIDQPENEIDYKRLEEVTKLADIYDFINEELPDGFNAQIGERGIKLSGGQRQRLGLARALYRNPSVLILDEATSALDNITENSIIESLESLPEDLTIILIAHRLSTVRHADSIYLLQNGRIVEHGSYKVLKESSETFRTMVNLA